MRHVANSPIVSQVHATLTRDLAARGATLRLKRSQLHHGIYRGKKRKSKEPPSTTERVLRFRATGS